jgi:hypothetical protein
MGLGRGVVPRHPQPINGEELFDCEDAGCSPHHVVVVKELTVLWVAVSSTVELVLGHSPSCKDRWPNRGGGVNWAFLLFSKL